MMTYEQARAKLRAIATGRTPDDAAALAPRVAPTIGWPERVTGLALRAEAFASTAGPSELSEAIARARKALSVEVAPGYLAPEDRGEPAESDLGPDPGDPPGKSW